MARLFTGRTHLKQPPFPALSVRKDGFYRRYSLCLLTSFFLDAELVIPTPWAAELDAGISPIDVPHTAKTRFPLILKSLLPRSILASIPRRFSSFHSYSLYATTPVPLLRRHFSRLGGLSVEVEGPYAGCFSFQCSCRCFGIGSRDSFSRARLDAIATLWLCRM